MNADKILNEFENVPVPGFLRPTLRKIVELLLDEVKQYIDDKLDELFPNEETEVE